MNVEILIVSYLKDKVWLEHSLNSVRKYASGFSRVTVLVPDDEKQHFSGMVAPFDLATYDRVKDPRLWHLDHQRMKCWTDVVCPHADIVYHLDSDAFFIEPVTPEDLCPDGKPFLMIDSYERLADEGCWVPWKPVVDYCMGGDNAYETMRAPMACFHRGVYKDTRDRIEAVHHKKFDQFVLEQKPDFPWGFTEFNMIGTMCLTPKWIDRYTVVDLGKVPVPWLKVIQFWSHSPPDKPQTWTGKPCNESFCLPGNQVIPQQVFDFYGV